MTEPQDNKTSATPRRRRVLNVLYGATVVAGIVLAWQIHETWIAPSVPAPVSPHPPEPARLGAAPRGLVQPSDLKRAEGRLGMRRLAGDPGHVPPPTGAEFAFGYEWSGSQGLHQQLTFRYAGQAEAAADHYRRILEDKQMKLASDRAVPGPAGVAQRALVFHASDDPVGDQVVIRLRRRKGGRVLSIGVTILRRAAAPAGQEHDDE